MAQVEFIWRAMPLHAPYVQRHCGSCRETRAFESSGRFRVNANRKKLDVWLIYRCRRCGFTWNRSLERRLAEAELGSDRVVAYRRDDSALAWEIAFDPQSGAERVDCRVERLSAFPQPAIVGASWRIELHRAWPCGVRLDRLLATELGASRSAIHRAARSGEIVVESFPGMRAALRRPIQELQWIVLAPDFVARVCTE